MTEDDQFAARVYECVGMIPQGRVMTYGQIAAVCGNPRAARIVGGLAHFGPEELPWHRVVNKQGGLASGFHGGRSEQARRLEAEGVMVDDNYGIDIRKLMWWPPGNEPNQPSLL